MNVTDFARLFIHTWEDGGHDDVAHTHSLDPDDAGNWSSGKVRVGRLVGSNHGVTAIILAKHRGCPVDAIVQETMAAVGLSEAEAIALAGYYNGTGIDRLPWNVVTAAMFDFAYTAGVSAPIEVLQLMIGAGVDGSVGPDTIVKFNAWCDGKTPEEMATQYAYRRGSWYRNLANRKPNMRKYLNGWINRANYYTPGDRNKWFQAFMS